METLGHLSRITDEHIELVTKVLTPELLWNDLRHLINVAEKCDHVSFEVMLGFAWGNHAEDEGWKELKVPTNQLESFVKQAEKKWEGELGYDDLYITLPMSETRIQYCHETDIHLRFAVPNSLTKLILGFWLKNGWILPSDLERVKKLVEHET